MNVQESATNISSYLPDELDLKIIALLQKDGRMSTQDIAASLDSTSSTIRKRIRKLEETGTMRGYTRKYV